MRLKKTAALLTAAALCTVLTAGCVTAVPEENTEGKNITVAISSDTGSMDPAGSIALTYLSYSVSALDELLTYNEDGEIEYRAAESYEVNEDSTVWTFHLREDALWSDGSPVTSADFLNTITRALDPASGSGYAVYLFPIENAEEIYNGEAEAGTLGVETPDDYTLIFRLEEPCVYFLDLLRLPVYTPSCAKYADSVESGWDRDPETSLSNGPFCLAEYVPDQYFVLNKNENYWDADEIKLDSITYRFFDDTQSMANAYEAGEVDVATSLSSAVMEAYEGAEDLLVTDQIATRYIYMNLNVEPLNDVRVREAINLAIDREELCRIVGSDTEPTYNLVAKYMKDKATGEYFVDGASRPFEEDVERARELLAEAGYPDGEGFPELTYNYPTLEMDSDTAQVIQEQLKKNLNIEIKLEAQELQANYSTRYSGEFDLCRMNWTADFSDPYTYLSMLLSNSTYNCSGIQDEVYDGVVEQSNSETDPMKRSELLHEAEQIAVGEQFYIIPLYAMKSVNLVNPDISGIRQVAASGALEYRYADVAENQ
ncbi:peptide ABC transporter substrate-binding protein [Ruminococcus sp. CLA-AA-H200]|uniref:Peptide ABC transporter substrate-binding protein n=1 Tax=Ruminococcus turbiniformis TaxID=2881258 RepID=A0ABS8G2V4_9FIRM|nr:peptide ABC transporter substrate-binding protein [Ruminococcus turbiniformis]MCC2255913.1 peptide ABC transporter substrate-binding protein [Ruminococcus turbiniformis]